jgi:hypothetical protein
MGSRVPAVTGPRTRVGGAARWYWLAGLLTATLLLCAVSGTSGASAASFYWYGASPDCWQTGPNPGSSGTNCQFPGGTVISDAITGDVNTLETGEYCNVYFSTSTICNNEDSNWPLSFKTTSACASGNPFCGIQNYVSFAQQGDYPWASWAGQPALVIANILHVTAVKGPSSAWAYVCPVLEAPVRPRSYLEYCFDQWQGEKSQSNFPEAPPFAGKGYAMVRCGNVTVQGENGVADTIISPYAYNQPTPYATTTSGSSNTLTGGTTGERGFQIEVTSSDLENAIARDNSTCAPRGLPNSVASYRLVGIEDGIEGLPNTQLSATMSSLSARTEYTPVPPTASTSAAAGVQERQATVSGSVNPNGIDTHYYFQYGTTTSYGATAPAPPGSDAGSGVGSVPASTTISGLEQATTYHYRLVAINGVGEAAYGGDQTFTTHSPTVALQTSGNDLFMSTGAVTNTKGGMLKGTSPSIAALPGGGYEAAFQANNGVLWLYSSLSGTGSSTGLGMEKGTSPSIAALPGGGYVVAFQANSGDDLWVYSSVTGVGVNTNQGMLAGTSPSIAALPGGGYVVAFQNNIDDLSVWSSTGGGVNTVLGMSAGSSPSIAALSGGGYEVAVRANDTNLWLYSSATGKGSTQGLGVSSGTNPSIAGLAGGGYEVAFHASDSNLWLYSSASEKGSTQDLGMLAGASPSIAALSGGGFGVAFEASNARLWTYSSSTGEGSTEGLEMLAGTNPSLTVLPGSGYNVALQNNGNDLSISSGVNTSTILGMLKGTSPSIAALPGGGYEAAVQANNGALWLYSSLSGTGSSTGLGMEKGTSPSIAALPGGGYVVAFQANSGDDLWVYSSVTGVGVNTNQGMLAGTSPSIAALPGGGYVVAFQNNIDDLSVWSSTGGGVNTVLGMSAGSSPSIAALSGGGYEVAVRANDTNLWLYSSATEKGSTQGLGVSSGTNPSIAALSGGGYEVAFHASDSNLWLYSSATQKGSTQDLGMLTGANPSIAAVSGGGFEVAFEASNARLWTYSSSTGEASTEGLEMLAGTNPSIAE